MDDIRHTLAIAAALKKSYRAGSYYKYLDAVHLTLDLLGSESLFRPVGGLDRSIVERLFKVCESAVRRAGEQIDAVLDLDEKSAKQASEQSALNAEPIEEDPTGTTFSVPKRETCQSVSGKKPNEDDSKTIEDKARSAPVMIVEEEFGDEPALGVRDPATLPMIPISSLYLAQCQEMLDMQLLMQRLEPLANATPKQRSNALYLDAVQQLVVRLRGHALRKLDLQDASHKAMELRVRAIPPGELARQITRLQMEIFRRVPIGELDVPIHDRASHAPCLSELVAFSQYITHWCQYEVLRYATAQDRAGVLAHLIRTTTALADLANYESCRAMVAGLTSHPLRRLRQTMVLLPKRLRNELDSLGILVSERRDYAQLRETLDRRATPCIPPVVTPVRWEEFQSSAYLELFPAQPNVQHYLLIQPYRWEEELFSISVAREPPGRIESRETPALTGAEEERLAFADDDVFEIIGRKIQNPNHWSSSSPRSVSSEVSPDVSARLVSPDVSTRLVSPDVSTRSRSSDVPARSIPLEVSTRLAPSDVTNLR
ncbi:hypothetical protein PSACC_00060 [Paramicrosporidium saccamoebae]|uniref:Ras-GEF domain-containing protein n=1 Tax=Paramicrosporidium saccamoebae TaxID=1246581 RepID=A0A2H9TQX4_9FUNG|nr:hypothetical protein PSACC_00060 [Paramicrosporidium saccamoebae]